MIQIQVGRRLNLTGLPADLERQFIRENSFTNPKRETLERLGKWTGNEPQTIDLWTREDGRLILPRGYLTTAIHALKQATLPYVVRDCTVCPPLREQIKATGSLYPYQERALANLLRWPTGVLEAPTGSGKTIIMLAAIARLETPALIIVHTTELFDQTCDRVRSWLGVEPGAIAGSKAILRPVTVGMIQTLSRRDLQAQGIADYFGAVLVDEAHHSPAMTWAEILEQMPAKYKYGFTATAWRKDGLQFLIWRLIGGKSAKIIRGEVEEAGKIVWPDVETVETDYFYPLEDASEWGSMISDLVTNCERNHLITREVRSRLKGSRALILTDRIEHTKILAGELRDLKPVLLIGEMKKSQREKAMTRVRNGTRLTIATIHLLGEGVDVPGWDLLFLVSPIAGGPRTLQAVGRVARPAPGKDRATVVDFVDSRIRMLTNAARSRQRLYGGAA
jgi:superfamily II DNA or RNA helicase